MATGTVTITEETISKIKKVKFEWTSTAGGAAGDVTTNAYTGEIIRLITKPGTGGNQPNDNYSVVVNDEDSTDVLMGAGASRDELNTEQVLASSLGCVANDKLTLAVTGAGDSNQGTVILYIK